jgi:hypothetical protein
MTDDQVTEQEDRPPVLLFMDRVQFLMKTDDRLTVAECIGALHLLAYEAAQYAFEDNNESES